MPSFLLSLWTSPCGISLSATHTTSVDICTAHIQLFPSPVRVLHSLPHQLWLLGTEVRDHPIFPCPAECSDMLVGFPEHQAALQVGYRMPSSAELPGPQLLDALSPTPQKLVSSYRQLEKSCCKKWDLGYLLCQSLTLTLRAAPCHYITRSLFWRKLLHKPAHSLSSSETPSSGHPDFELFSCLHSVGHQAKPFGRKSAFTTWGPLQLAGDKRKEHNACCCCQPQTFSVPTALPTNTTAGRMGVIPKQCSYRGSLPSARCRRTINLRISFPLRLEQLAGRLAFRCLYRARFSRFVFLPAVSKHRGGRKASCSASIEALGVPISWQGAQLLPQQSSHGSPECFGARTAALRATNGTEHLHRRPCRNRPYKDPPYKEPGSPRGRLAADDRVLSPRLNPF